LADEQVVSYRQLQGFARTAGTYSAIDELMLLVEGPYNRAILHHDLTVESYSWRPAQVDRNARGDR